MTDATPDIPAADVPDPAQTMTVGDARMLASQIGFRLIDSDDAEGFHLRDDGTTVIRFTPPGDTELFEVRCPPPTLDGYELIVNAIEDARDEIATMREGNDTFRKALAEYADDPAPGSDGFKALRKLRRDFDRKDNADQLRIRRLSETLIRTAVANSTDDGKGGGTVLPDRIPVWLSTWGNVDVLMAHWEKTPFRGPAGSPTR